METATPYDITPIPIAAFEPGIMLWLLVLIFGIFSLYLTRRLWRRRAPRSRRAALRLAEEAIARLTPESRDSERKLSLLLRRLANHITDLPALALSLREIEALQANSESDSQKELLALIVEVERDRYSGSTGTHIADYLHRALVIVKRLQGEDAQ